MPSFAVTSPSWFSSTQELRENGRLIGGLVMLKKWTYALTEMRVPGRAPVRFGYKGWTSRTLFIQDALGKDIASVKSLSWWKRDVAVSIDGRTYEFKRKDWWGARCGWFAQDGREIAEFRMNWLAKIDISTPTPLDETEMLLLFFGIYMLQLQMMDAASSGA